MTSEVDRSEAARRATATRKRNAALRGLAGQKLQPAMLQPREAVKANAELDYGVRKNEVPDRQDIDAVLKFLPVFESPGFVFGTMVESKDQLPFGPSPLDVRRRPLHGDPEAPPCCPCRKPHPPRKPLSNGVLNGYPRTVRSVLSLIRVIFGTAAKASLTTRDRRALGVLVSNLAMGSSGPAHCGPLASART